MNTIRSLLFSLWLYLSMPICAVGLSPALLMSHGPAMGVIRIWARMVLFGLRWIMGVKVEVRGLEHRPTGGALVAAKHQSMLDVVAPFTFLDDPCFVLKKELMPLPFFGWFAWKTKMIPVDRAAHAKALRNARLARLLPSPLRRLAGSGAKRCGEAPRLGGWPALMANVASADIRHHFHLRTVRWRQPCQLVKGARMLRTLYDDPYGMPLHTDDALQLQQLEVSMELAEGILTKTHRAGLHAGLQV